MTKERSETSPNTPGNTPRRRYCNPFLVIFYALCDLICWFFRPRNDFLHLQNKAIRAQIESQKAELEKKVRQNDELEKLNSTLEAHVMTLQAEGKKLQRTHALRGNLIRTTDRKHAHEKKSLEKLEKELQTLKKKNIELDAQKKNQESSVNRQIVEYQSIIGEYIQKNRSLEEKVRNQDKVLEKQMRNIMSQQTGLAQLQAVNNAVKSDKQELDMSNTRMEQENSRLKDDILNIET